MNDPSVIGLIRSVCAAYALRSGNRPVVVRLGTEEWDEFEAWAKCPGRPITPAYERGLMLGTGEYVLGGVRVGRLVNVGRGIAVEGAPGE